MQCIGILLVNQALNKNPLLATLGAGTFTGLTVISLDLSLNPSLTTDTLVGVFSPLTMMYEKFSGQQHHTSPCWSVCESAQLGHY